MAKDPAFLFYYQDFLVGTSFMTLEEVGAYIKLLCFQADRGHLQEKDILKKITPAIWEAIRCKFVEQDGLFYNARLSQEVEKRRLFTESRRKNLHMDSHMVKHMRGAMTPHMENENENINKDKDVNINKGIIKGIIDDLNFVLGTLYKPNGKASKEAIQARLNEGFTIEDFKTVHRKMVRAWGADAKMYKFLRPITLYSNKFESYLNYKEFTTKLTETGVKAYIVGQEWLKKQEIIDVK